LESVDYSASLCLAGHPAGRTLTIVQLLFLALCVDTVPRRIRCTGCGFPEASIRINHTQVAADSAMA
jgi:hypothetical protein